MGFDLTARDEDILSTVHPDLQAVVRQAARTAPFRFRVLEGVRTLARQKELVDRGASKTMNSRHLTGHAIDLAPYFDANDDGKIDGADMWHWPLYDRLAPIMKAAARDVGVPVEWGGDWRSFRDGPHWQLPWSAYPADAPVRAARIDPPVDRPKTHTTAVATVATGGVAATVAPVIPDVVNALTVQEDNLTSGDWTRIVFGLALVVLAVIAVRTR